MTQEAIARTLLDSIDGDPEQTITAVRDALEALAELLAIEEPHAVRSIADLQSAADKVNDLMHLLADLTAHEVQP